MMYPDSKDDPLDNRSISTQMTPAYIPVLTNSSSLSIWGLDDSDSPDTTSSKTSTTFKRRSSQRVSRIFYASPVFPQQMPLQSQCPIWIYANTSDTGSIITPRLRFLRSQFSRSPACSQMCDLLNRTLDFGPAFIHLISRFGVMSSKREDMRGKQAYQAAPGCLMHLTVLCDSKNHHGRKS